MEDIKLAKEEKIRVEVISASQQLFQRYGYQKTTMEDIARATGRGKSTLYYYYKSKEEIFEAIVVKEAREFFGVISRNVEKAPTAEEKLKAYILAAYQVMREKAVLNSAIFNEVLQVGGLSVSQPSMIEHLNRFNASWLLTIRGILVFGVENKEFNESVVNELDTISNVLMSSLMSTVLMLTHFENAPQADSLMPVPEVLVSLVKILINGLK